MIVFWQFNKWNYHICDARQNLGGGFLTFVTDYELQVMLFTISSVQWKQYLCNYHCSLEGLTNENIFAIVETMSIRILLCLVYIIICQGGMLIVYVFGIYTDSSTLSLKKTQYRYSLHILGFVLWCFVFFGNMLPLI